MPTEPAKGVSADYLKLNKLGKVPTFEGADGFTLSECVAIAVYCTLIFFTEHPSPPYIPQQDEAYYHFSYPCLNTSC